MTKGETFTLELRDPYFKGVAGTYYLKYGDEKIALDVDSRGRFNWTPSDVPIGVFARQIKEV